MANFEDLTDSMLGFYRNEIAKQERKDNAAMSFFMNLLANDNQGEGEVIPFPKGEEFNENDFDKSSQ